MKQIEDQAKREIEAKLANVFSEEINELSTESREILLNDMVTALENRLKVLINVARKTPN